MDVFLCPQDHTGSWQDTSNSAKDDNNESCCLLLYCCQTVEGRISWAHIIQPLLFWPLTWWDPEPHLSNNGTEWVGTWLPPLNQDIADPGSISVAGHVYPLSTTHGWCICKR